jgi:hypothetical protein
MLYATLEIANPKDTRKSEIRRRVSVELLSLLGKPRLASLNLAGNSMATPYRLQHLGPHLIPSTSQCSLCPIHLTFDPTKMSALQISDKAAGRKIRAHKKSRRGCGSCKLRAVKVNAYCPSLSRVND